MKKMFQVGFAAFVLVVVAAGGQENQPAVARVDQILPFAITGQVTSATTSPKPDDTSTTSAPVQNTTAPALLSVTTAGGSISSGADGGVSLILGSSAQTGTARLAEDSEVKVPDESEKGYSLEVLKGKLFLNISADQLKRQGNAEFKLKTPAALLAVKGTKFFCRSIDGKDTVCVHEGSVEVTEPSTGKTLTIQAGQAAEISPGILSEMREMTDEETAQTSHYDLAALEQQPVILSVEKKKDGKSRGPYVTSFFNGSLAAPGSPESKNSVSILFEQPSKIFATGALPGPFPTEQAAVRYLWNPRSTDPEWVTNCDQNIGWPSWTRLKGTKQRHVALGCQVRCLSVQELKVCNKFGTGKPVDSTKVSVIPPESKWVPLLIHLERLNLEPQGGYKSWNYIYVEAKVLRSGGSLPSKSPAVIEMKDFVVYSTP